MPDSPNPVTPPTPPTSPSPQGAKTPPPTFSSQSTNALDAWRQLLQGGSSIRPTDEQVKKFMQGAMKMCANCIQDSLRAHQRAMQKLKDAAEGNS